MHCVTAACPVRGPYPGARDTSLCNVPLHDTAQNRIWLETVSLALGLLPWMPMLTLTGKTCRWEPKKLRLRLFSAAAGSVSLADGPRPTHQAIDRLHALQGPDDQPLQPPRRSAPPPGKRKPAPTRDDNGAVTTPSPKSTAPHKTQSPRQHINEDS